MRRSKRSFAALPKAAAAFTRPGALALPLALGIVLLVRMLQARRGGLFRAGLHLDDLDVLGRGQLEGAEQRPAGGLA